MNHGRPVYWHEGVFLRPQHFQQQDEYHDSKGYYLAGIHRPFPWGVGSLELSPSALLEQVVEVTSCDVLFQDGTRVRCPDNARAPSRSFAGSWDAQGDPLAVYLALRRLSPEGVNVPEAGAKGGAGTRFRVSDGADPTRDLYARDTGQPVLYLEYDVSLLFGDEAREATDCSLIQVAEVERSGTELRYREEYIPPALTLGASPHLLGLWREVKEQLVSRGFELSQYKSSVATAAADLTPRDLLSTLALSCLNRWIPLLHQVLQSPRLSPWEGYAVLRQVAGELSSFSAQYDVFGAPMGADAGEGLPEYHHGGLETCFAGVARVIARMLEELAAGPDFVAPLLFDGTYYHSELPQRVFQAGSRYFLCVRCDGDPGAVVGLLQSMAKLSSKEYLPILIARALPGVPVSHLPSPPSKLPRRPDSVYFELAPGGPEWEMVRDNLNLGVYMESVPGNIEIELMVIHGG